MTEVDEMDDLDRLLDELREQGGTVFAQELKEDREAVIPQDTGDVLDELIGEMLNDGDEYFIESKTAPSIAHTKKDIFTDKCKDPWVRYPANACTNLRCMKCDFAVVHFENAIWANGADYLFFRNFYPNREKLNTRLLLKSDHLSSCCQCKWRTVRCGREGIVTVQSGEVGENPMWACFGH